jgi:Mn2+/Fe2+ NRAMP family transporter
MAPRCQGDLQDCREIFIVSVFFYGTYIISAFLIPNMDWGGAVKSLVVPSFQLNAPYITLLIALIGTNITPWMQFYLQSSVVEKGLKPKDYKYSKWDVILGCLMTDIITFFIIVATAATLFKAGIVVSDAGDAAAALASLLFSFGLLNAALLGAAILPLTTAYHVCEGLGWDAGINKKWKEAPQFYFLFTATLVFGVLVVLIPKAPLLNIMFFSQVLNGVLIPFILVFMLSLVNDKDLMGKNVNTPILNIIAWITSAALILLTVAMIVLSFWPNALSVFGL